MDNAIRLSGRRGLGLGLLLAMTGLLFTPPAHTELAPNAARMDVDVQSLLVNDEQIAQVKNQLHAREITDVEYTKRLQQLNKSRTAVLNRYSKADEQDLIALYDATKKDEYLSGQEAKRWVAGEATSRATATKTESGGQKAAAQIVELRVQDAPDQLSLASSNKFEQRHEPLGLVNEQNRQAEVRAADQRFNLTVGLVVLLSLTAPVLILVLQRTRWWQRNRRG